MTQPLRQAWVYQKGKLFLWADTLEGLDAKFDKYTKACSAAREKRVRAALTRRAGKELADYKRARAALSEAIGD